MSRLSRSVHNGVICIRLTLSPYTAIKLAKYMKQLFLGIEWQCLFVFFDKIEIQEVSSIFNTTFCLGPLSKPWCREVEPKQSLACWAEEAEIRVPDYCSGCNLWDRVEERRDMPKKLAQKIYKRVPSWKLSLSRNANLHVHRKTSTGPWRRQLLVGCKNRGPWSHKVLGGIKSSDQKKLRDLDIYSEAWVWIPKLACLRNRAIFFF